MLKIHNTDDPSSAEKICKVTSENKKTGLSLSLLHKSPVNKRGIFFELCLMLLI